MRGEEEEEGEVVVVREPFLPPSRQLLLPVLSAELATVLRLLFFDGVKLSVELRAGFGL